jgi:hypothetical protein
MSDVVECGACGQWRSSDAACRHCGQPAWLTAESRAQKFPKSGAIALYDQWLVYWHAVDDARIALEEMAPGESYAKELSAYGRALAPFFRFTLELCYRAERAP